MIVSCRLVGPLLALLLTACTATGPSPDPGSTYSGPVSLSALLSRPLSWEKLDDLENWIDRYGSTARAYERNEARLALADGRETFIRQDEGKVSAAVLSMRRSRAQDDYQVVLSDGGASSAQRARAQHGIARLEGLYAGVPQTAASQLPIGTSLSIIRRSAWGAAPENPRNMSLHKAPWNRITVHHTAMPQAYSATQNGRAAELRVIQRAHLNKPEGWGDIGYHFLIDPEGRIYEGRQLTWRGAHVKGMNDHNLGVCLMGNFDQSNPTPAAIASLERLLDDLRAQNGIGRNAVTWHKEWPSASTECPGDRLVPFVRRYRDGSSLVGAGVPASPSPFAATQFATTRKAGGAVR